MLTRHLKRSLELCHWPQGRWDCQASSHLHPNGDRKRNGDGVPTHAVVLAFAACVMTKLHRLRLTPTCARLASGSSLVPLRCWHGRSSHSGIAHDDSPGVGTSLSLKDTDALLVKGHRKGTFKPSVLVEKDTLDSGFVDLALVIAGHLKENFLPSKFNRVYFRTLCARYKTDLEDLGLSSDDLKGRKLTSTLKTFLSKVKVVLENHYEAKASSKGASKVKGKSN